MEHLPDDVLVTLMEYLDVEGLLACRLVCKRVGGLALHRDVWRHRQLPGYRCVCPVLRLAPRVASLSVELPHRRRCGLAYIATRCAVTRLSLSLRKDYDAMRAAAVICRQEALGRLRSVQVHFGRNLDDVSYVLGTLATTADLEELQVTGLTYHVTATAAAVAVLGSPVSTPSLRFFRCELVPQTEHFVNFILAGHAATLQKVDVGHRSYDLRLDFTGHLLAVSLRSRDEFSMLWSYQ
ncbi:uncharacterized protein LOC127750958 [Frankliniella occidentalis]|uniref:Uncharacterized protein LOC127750958 n=1 Tax=Frankliniella occidentalis TaxID=133901 RepID=A0A9C6XT53_FRAOC|nr:uncharacterized protein LOC127750958 [Frankliniella occidentalis]